MENKKENMLKKTAQTTTVHLTEPNDDKCT